MAQFLEKEDFSDKNTEMLIKFFANFLTTKKVRINSYTKNTHNFEGEDPNFCCYYFKIEGNLDELELSIVFDKKNKKILTSKFIIPSQESKPKEVEIFSFKSIEEFNNNFLKISQKL